MNEQKKINDKFNHINKNLQKEIKATVEGERKCKAKQNNKQNKRFIFLNFNKYLENFNKDLQEV